MSYDIRFKVRERETGKWISAYNPEANITWNVRDIICKSTGLEWNNCEDNGYVKDVVLKIESGLNELRQHPEKYAKYESSNGWGTVSSTEEFFTQILTGWDNAKRIYGDELANAFRFWIE